ncbi:MAG: Yip1 family protein [bacterium]
MRGLRNVWLVFTSPGAVARDVADRPDWKTPLAVLILASVVFTLAMYSYQMEYQREVLERWQKETGTQIDIDSAVKPSTGRQVGSAVGGALAVALFTLVGAAVLNGVAMLAGGVAGFRKMFAFFAYALVIASAGNLLKIPLAIAKKSVDVRMSLAAFAPGLRLESPTAILLNSTDVFVVWSLVATVIGFAALTQLSTKKSAVIVVVMYAAFVLLEVGATALGARAMR